MEYSIEVKNLTKKYKNSKDLAVDHISFNVYPGEFFAFLGPNGAGKTTTISILTTTLSKTTGSVKINGFDLEKESAKVRESIGIIFQKPSIDLNLTAEENIRFHSVLYKIYPFYPAYSLMPKDYKKRLFELSEIIGIKKDLFRPVKEYSGGMKRKLEIIRSLMHSPQTLFLDEPTSGLDPESRKNLWDYLKTVKKQSNTTIFLTTHYLDEAEDADNVCIIKNGKIVNSGSPTEIKNKIAKEYLILKLKHAAKVEEVKSVTDSVFELNGRTLKIYFNDVGEIRKLIDKFEDKIKTIEIKRPSLEDAYISIIKDNMEV